MDIHEIRKRIDELDEDLLRIFNERSALAVQIGEIKKELGLPIYDSGREMAIFERLRKMNRGPLDDQAIVRLFERVIDESRHLERIHSGKK
ncbi:MAG: chorismate mutase [Desulfuromonadaceae bacterium]|nr:chorismate mutase [Desulfuromonadaceae bacterium]